MKRTLIFGIALLMINSNSFGQGLGGKLKNLAGGNKEAPEGAFITNGVKIYSFNHSAWTKSYFAVADGSGYSFKGAQGMAVKNQEVFTLSLDKELPADLNADIEGLYRIKIRGSIKTDKLQKQWGGLLRGIKTTDGVFIFYSFKEYKGHSIIGVPYAMEPGSALDEDPIILSDDQSKIDAWSGKKAIELINTYEGALHKMVTEKMEEKDAGIKMPDAGELHAKHKAEVEAALKKYCASKGVDYKTMVIESSDYNVLRNKNTGIVTGRQYWGHYVNYSSERKESPCRVFVFVMQQQHDGNDFTGKFFLKDSYKDSKLLTIPCANVK